ncbi:hypothetical protein BH09PAT3_BH09PAT3_4090 [soil metagenome]
MTLQTHRRQAGDTIVEVLIAIAVISLVLVGAFVVANNSTRSVQDNQEHTQAQQHLQTQIEALRAYMIDKTETELPSAGASYCINDSGVPTTGACTPVKIGGTTAKPTFVRTGNVYKFTITWPSVKGGNAQEQYVYRAYPIS